MNRRQRSSTWPGMAAVVVLATNAAAAIINVPGDQPSIQAAIDAAVDGDEISVAPGTYFESINFLGKAITLRSTDPTDPDVVAATIIDGTGNFHVVQCVNGEGPDTVLNGFVITGGNADGVPDNRGGGMYNLYSSPTVINCSFNANTADWGGGMSNLGSSPTVTNCSFNANTADWGGGGAWTHGDGVSPTFVNCTFSDNSAERGGAIAVSGNVTLTLSHCTFSNNTAEKGGAVGVLLSYASPVVSLNGCTFLSNAGVLGGGVFQRAGAFFVTDCLFTDNTAAGGGAIFSLGGVSVTGSQFCDNAPTHISGEWSDDGGNSFCPLCFDSGILTVPSDYPTIQEALAAACDGSEIVVSPGTYYGPINFAGKALTVVSSAGPEVTTIDGQGAGSVVICANFEGSGAVLNGFTITGGAGTAQGGSLFGGGMYNLYSSPTVIACLFNANTADWGGGMYNSGSSPTLTNCTFSGNTSGGSGGAIRALGGSAIIAGCFFSGNSPSALSLSGGDFTLDLCTFTDNSGGAISFSQPGVRSITRCTFIGNSSESVAGAVYASGGDHTFLNCSFIGNSAESRGGAVYSSFSATTTLIGCVFSANTSGSQGGAIFGGSDLTVSGCHFSGNCANSGAAIYNQGPLSVSSSRFVGNEADHNGGAIYNTNPYGSMVVNCLFTGNAAIFGGGLFNWQGAQATVVNCTLIGNSANDLYSGGGGIFSWQSDVTVANCILRDNIGDQISNWEEATVSFSNVQGGYAGTGNIDADPIFLDPDDGDFRLQPGSPCIDAGDNAAVPMEITTDLDGNPRFVEDLDTYDTGNGDPPIVDMGAYEFQLPCPWDLNGDGEVNVLDLIELVMSFGPCEDCPADFDDDGFVGVLDLITLLMNLGPCPGTECIWDVNGDGVVDQSDVQAVTSNLGPCEDPENCPWDVNSDGVVNGQDVQAVASHFGPCS